MKVLVLIVASLVGLSAYAQQGGRAIKQLANDIDSAAQNFRAYNQLNQREKQTLRQELRNVKQVMRQLGMIGHNSGPGYPPNYRNKYYCDGSTLKVLATGRVDRYTSTPAVCNKVIRADRIGSKYYCEGATLKHTNTGRVDRYNASSQVCAKVLRAHENNDSFYCEGATLKKTVNGRVDRYTSSARQCERLARQLNY